MTLDEAELWLREHNIRQGAVRVGLEWKFMRKETTSLSSSGAGHAGAICAVVNELKAGG